MIPEWTMTIEEWIVIILIVVMPFIKKPRRTKRINP